MKTLDEVIKAFECCQNVECNECPYKILFNDDTHVPCDQLEKDDDALHYLKEYQKIEDEYEELKDWWAEEHAENVPLTWDELKTMEGKPVWMEELSKGLGWYGFWDVISDVEDYGDEKTVYTKSEMMYEMAEYGTTWNAYRKERE